MRVLSNFSHIFSLRDRASFTCLPFTLQEKMAARNSRKRNAPARLREGKQLRMNRVYERTNWSTNDHACISCLSWELDLHWSCSVSKSWFHYVNDCDPKSSKPINTCTLVVYNTCHTTKFTLEDSVTCILLHVYRSCHVKTRKRQDNLYWLDLHKKMPVA